MPVWYGVSKDDLRVARKIRRGERVFVDPKLKEGETYKMHGNVPPPPSDDTRKRREDARERKRGR